ncbi:condensin complex subunit 1-like isoform X2 [Daphnia pulicaria]|uniref:condensin complex subunit 1-like isoform X2 n=1 Tax=Daphnia pulicaria TaxID=35523 RepID=UPI001EEB2522|nr:condensin complex subunit 1-like isoform X2 [Daphnia pulicaria]
MDGLEFVISENKEDLLHSSSPNQYVVEQTYSKHELPGKLRDAYVSFSRQGTVYILTHFDTLFSALVKFDELALSQQNDAWKVVSQSIPQLISDVNKHLNSDDNNPETCKELVTITKMIVYLLCLFLQNYETRSLVVPGSDAKSGRKKKKPVDDGFDLEAERNFAITSLDHLIQLPIHKLWSPPVVEQEFVNLVSNACYKILENPSISHVRLKGTVESVFRVIGALVKRYNHGLGFQLKIIQLLQHFEHVAPACVHGLVTMIELFGCSQMVVELVREIGKVDPHDLARDTSSSRNYAAFLSELAERVPSAFIPCISLLSVHLEEESFTMRNSALSIFAEIVMQELSGEDLDERKRELRDQLLDPLLEHLHDVHSFVRSKTLQLWHKLSLKHAIPLNLQHKVLTMTTGRLNDKTGTVRKNAVQLLIVLMQGNPYGERLPLEELGAKKESEEAKLKEMLEASGNQPQRIQVDPSKCGPTKTELWNAMEPEILVAIHEVFDEEDIDMSMSELTNEEVIQQLNACNYKRVARMFITEDDEEQEDPVEILDKIKSIFVGDEDNDGEREEMERLVQEAVEQEIQQPPQEEESKEIGQQRMLVMFLKDSHAFASSVYAAIPMVCQLLCSKQTSDILEAIDFFVTAFEFDVLDAMQGVRRMLSLIWSSEEDVKKAVVNAYKRLYMNMEATGSKRRALQVVSNLSALISLSTQGELASLEELIAMCVKSGDLPKICIQVMWEKFSMALPDTTEEESRSALMLLTMVASAEVQVVTSNVNVLVSVGLGERGSKDFRLAHLTCAALLKMAPTKAATDCKEQPMRFPPTNEIFECSKKLLVEGLTRLEDVHYSQFATTSVSLIYTLAEHPDMIMGDVLKEMCAIVYKSSRDQSGNLMENAELEVPTTVLTRIFVVAGQVALRQLIHLDVHVYSELRRRARVREEKQEETSKQKRNLLQSASRRRVSTRPQQEQCESGEDDELVGAVADDDEAEYVRKICESEIVTGGHSLLSSMAPLVILVNSNPAKYPDPSLRAAASLCLAEFMLVSPQFCSQHLRLLFTVLEKSPEEVIRSNLVIAMGDLNFRFPNLIEPWTPNLYSRLRDDSPIVKRTTLNVLSHLILNDMVKVKGQISDIALCVIDPDTRISSMSRMFFSEFARKGNALYNVMPDIISRLCDPEAAVAEENFRVVLKGIIVLIQKDKQNESLVEKIILRLGASRTERQSRDLMYCLSLLTFNERSLRRILEHWNCISDKIHEEGVVETLNAILATTKKAFAKQEIRGLIDEIEAKIKETVDADQDEQQVVRKAQASQVTKAQAPKNKPKRKQRAKDSEEEEVSMDDDEPEMPGHPAHLGTPHSSNKKTPLRHGRNIRKKIAIPQVSSDDESSVEEDEDDDDDSEKEDRKAQLAAKLKKNMGSTRSIRATRRQTEADSGSDQDVFIKPASRGKSNPGKNKLSEKKKSTTTRSRR